jgi:hypothetical protein
MAQIVNFVYVIIIFFSVFFVTKNVDGKIFFYPLHIFLITYAQYFIRVTFFSLSFVTAIFKCFQDSDCPQSLCQPPIIPRCATKVCLCHGRNLLIE